MAGQSVVFDFLTRGADSTAGGFRKLGDNALLASRGAKVLADVFDKLKDKENRTAEESVILAKALRQTGDAEDRVAARAVLADAAIRRLDDSMKKASKDSGGLGKTLSGLKLNPGLLGPAVTLLPAVGVAGGVAAGAVAGLGGAFIAGAGALAAFGVVAKPVLTSAKTAADAVGKAQATYNATLKAGVPTAQAQATLQAANASAQLTYTAALKGGAKPAAALAAYHLALAKNQLAYNKATNAGAFTAKAYAAEQAAISKAYAGMSPQQIALSKQLGAMANAWSAVKAAQTPVVSGALQPWLKSVTDLTKNLGPIIQAVSPVIGGLGVQFDALINSAAFKGFRDFIAGTGSAAVSAGGSTIIDLVKSFMILLPKFDPLIRVAVGWIAALGPAVLKWSSSKKSSDDIQAFIQFFVKNGPQVGTFLTNIGGALKALAPGLTSGGLLELKVISDFLGWVAKLPPAFARPLAEVAGSLLILSKMGVLKVGVKIVGAAVKWLTGGLISIGDGAAAAAAMRAAFTTGGAAAAAEMRAALAGGGAVAGAEGGAAGVAGTAAKGAPFALATLTPALIGAAAGIALGIYLNKYHVLDHPAPAAQQGPRGTGGAAGPAASSIDAWKTYDHLIDQAGINADALRTKNLVPLLGEVGKVSGGIQGLAGTIQNTLLGQLRAAGTQSDNLRTKNLVPLLGEAGKTSGGIQGLAGLIKNNLAPAMTTGGAHADNLRNRNLGPLRGELSKTSGGVQGLQGLIKNNLAPAMDTGGRHANSFRTNNLGPLRGELSKDSGGVQGLQGLINAMHGKTVKVNFVGSGSGSIAFKESVPGVTLGPSSGGLLGFHAAGGQVGGHGGPRADNQLIAASSGEFVHQVTAVSKYGVPAMEAVNAGKAVIAYAGGGVVGAGGTHTLSGITGPHGVLSAGQPYMAKAEAAFGRVVEAAFAKTVIAKFRKDMSALGGSGPGIVRYARGFLGKIPYVFGGNSLSGGIDCSGFTQQVYGHFGIHAPRTSEAQFAWATPSGAVPGALAFYVSPAGGAPPGHVAIVQDAGTVISQGGGMGPNLMGLHAMPLMGIGVPKGGFPSSAGGSGNAAIGGGAIQAIARSILAQYGWANQWNSFNALETREAGWNMFAVNPSSKAYGLAQMDVPPGGNLAANKAKYFDYGGNPNTALGQLTAMMNYIHQIYPSGPNQAWSHEVSAGWYDRGGFLKPGLTLAYNGTGRPEQVIPAGGSGGRIVLEVRGSGHGTFDAFLLKWIRENVRVHGGGDVQKAYGR